MLALCGELERFPARQKSRHQQDMMHVRKNISLEIVINAIDDYRKTRPL